MLFYKSIVILLAILCFINPLMAQKDTTMYIVVPKESYTTIYNGSGSYCLGGSLDVINSPKYFIVCGIEECKDGGYERGFYQVMYKEDVHLVKKDDVVSSTNVYERIVLMSPEQRAAYYEKMVRIDSAITSIRRKEFLNILAKAETKGILILSWSVNDESEHTKGTGVAFEVYNPTKKVIKYIWFTVTGYNPVGDKVIDPTRRQSAITMKGVGPIKSKDLASYDFDYTWFTDMVETAKINSIKVQYMDGSMKVIPFSKDLVLDKNLYEEFLGDD